MNKASYLLLRVFVGTCVVLALASSAVLQGGGEEEWTAETALAHTLRVLAAMDPCERALVERVVVNQGPVLTPNSFHQISRTFDELGLHFDKIEKINVPLEIQQNFASHTVLSVVRVYRNDVYTEFSAVETRVGVPRALAQRVDARFGWERTTRGDYVGVIDTDASGQTRGVAELTRINLNTAGASSIVEEEIERLHHEGQSIYDNIANDAIEFYLKQIERRSWSDATKARLVREFFAHLDQSTLAVSRLQSHNRIIGILQMIRAPFGRRILARDEGEELKVIKDEFGAWGDSVRKFGIRQVEVHHMSNAELYAYMDTDRLPDGRLKLFQPPVEIKMREQAIGIKRDCLPSDYEDIEIDGVPHVVLWGEGEVDEPARFAIDPEFNPRLFVEAMVQLAASAVDPHFSAEYNRRNRILISYNDLPGLYAWANLKKTGRHLIIDGKPWPIILAGGGEHIDALLAFSRKLEADDATALQAVKDSMVRSLLVHP